MKYLWLIWFVLFAVQLIPLASFADAGPSQFVIINEVMTGSEVNPENDHWIELYNPSEEEISLLDWQIRGVTQGGRWIDVSDQEGQSILPHGYFLISHYSNSSSSALAVRPQVTKSSIQIPSGNISIELKDSAGLIVDLAVIERQSNETCFCSWERAMTGSWSHASQPVNLKEGLANTFATPLALNSDQIITPPDDHPENPPDEPPADPPDVLPSIFINEILPKPKLRRGEEEFIELYNGGTESVDMNRWKLDDENSEDNKSYIFTNSALNYIIQPGGFLVLPKSETLISVAAPGDGVRLFDNNNNLINEYFYASDLPGRSAGRNPSSIDIWESFNHPTPGAVNIETNHPPVPRIILQKDSNYLSVNVTGEESADPDGDPISFSWAFEPGATDSRPNPLKYTYSTPGLKTIYLTVTDEYGSSANANLNFEAVAPGVSRRILQNYPFYAPINEFMVNPAGADEQGEWIELYNNTPEEMDLSEWYFDDADGASSPFLIPQDTSLEPGQYLVFSAPFFDLSLKNSNDEVRLLDPNREPKQIVIYTDAQEGLSYARLTDNSFKWTSIITPGALNQLASIQTTDDIQATFNTVPAENEIEEIPQSNAPDCFSPFLIIDSILPNVQKGKTEESIWLKNQGTELICLTGWALDDSIGQGSKPYLISDGLLGAGETLAFNFQETKIRLNNQDDCASLIAPNGKLADKICYGKTHQNEIFTHAGGNWKPKPRIVRITRVNKIERTVSVIRPPMFYSYAFANTEETDNPVYLALQTLDYTGLKNHFGKRISQKQEPIIFLSATGLLVITFLTSVFLFRQISK